MHLFRYQVNIKSFLTLVFVLLSIPNGSLMVGLSPPTSSWKGDTSAFIFDQGILHSSFDIEKTEAHIYTPRVITGICEWNIRVQMDFNPSSSNYSQIYLSHMGTHPDSILGYYILVGGSKDEISLYRQEGRSSTVVISGIEKQLDRNAVDVRIKLMRSLAGKFTLHAKLNSEDSFELIGETIDSTFEFFRSFGIYCKYTKTRASLFHFSEIEIEGEPYLDNQAPEVDTLEVLTNNTIQIKFTEEIDFSRAQFGVGNNALKESTFYKDLVTLKFQNNFAINHTQVLTMEGIADTAGNRMRDTSILFSYSPPQLIQAFFIGLDALYLEFDKHPKGTPGHFLCNGLSADKIEVIEDGNALILFLRERVAQDEHNSISIRELGFVGSRLPMDTNLILSYHLPMPQELIITEIMADPTPTVYLPEAEYVELFNTSIYPISLYGPSIIVNGKRKKLKQYCQILPGEYLTLCQRENVHLFQTPEYMIGIPAFPALTNSGFELWIEREDSTVLDYISYTPNLYKTPYKAEGGWSLERMDPYNYSNVDNWAESTSKYGGTPGLENSVISINPDVTHPELVSYFITDTNSILLTFTERMDIEGLTKLDNYRSNLSILEVRPFYPSSHKVNIRIADQIKRTDRYPFNVSGLMDLNGNSLEAITIDIEIPELPIYNQIIFNEIMPEPLDGFPEYIEIYNRTDKFLNISDLMIGKLDENLELKSLDLITPEPYMLAPHEFYILTKTITNVIENYDLPIQQVIQVDNFPTLLNDNDFLVLMRKDQTLIDELYYHSDWHYAFIKSKKGVALERIDTEAPGNSENNWTSGASTLNYCSPGKANSQSINRVQQADRRKEIYIQSENISPNNDGYNDVLEVHFPPNLSGFSVNITIYDSKGRIVSKPYINTLLGTTSKLIWKGIDEDRYAAGIYIAHIEAINPKGKKHIQKLPFVISFK